MKQIHLIQIGPSNSALVSNLAYNLNSIQSEFLFSFNPKDVLAYPKDINENEAVPDDTLLSLVHEYAITKYKDEYSVAICDCLLKDKILTSSDNRKALITTQGWEMGASKHSIEKVIAYALVDILLESLNIITPTHDEPKGCPMDCELGSEKNLDACLSKSDFCPDCRSLILSAIGRGNITLHQMVAIYKILDFIAQRKLCFVLMPFKKKFREIYTKHIKSIFTRYDWVCNMAEEIHEEREIINIIWEQVLRADLIIADLTKRNPNVFYELGYAHALGKKTVLLTQSIQDVPFDLRHRQLVEYSPTPEGYKKLVQSIVEYIKK
jgi:hypothetical protein